MNNKSILSIRIKNLRIEYDLTQEELALKLGLKGKSSIANYESGKIIPSDKIKLEMCNLFNCSMDYLMGKSDYKTFEDEIQSLKETFSPLGITHEEIDSMLYQNTDLSEEENNILSELIAYSSECFDKGNVKNLDINTFLGQYPLTDKQKDNIIRNYIITLESQTKVISKLSKLSINRSLNVLDEYDSVLDKYDSVFKSIINQANDTDEKTKFSNTSAIVFVYGTIPAGIPVEAIEDIIDTEEISTDMLKGGKEYFGLKVKGNSMEPDYLDGDTLIILKQENCESGDDCVVMINGNDATFKRVFKNENGIILQPLNSQYEPLPFSNEQIEKLPIRILGKVVELRRKI